MTKCLLAILVFLLVKTCLEKLFEEPKPSLIYRKRQFWLDLDRVGSFINVVDSHSDSSLLSFGIKSARLPFSRITVNQWPHVLQLVAQSGLNTIELDVIWNRHVYDLECDFTYQSNDLVEFIKLAMHYKLFVLVRIDPYQKCTDYDFGGLPSWLLCNDTLKPMDLQSSLFVNSFTNYLNCFLPLLKPLQLSRQGPIIGFAIQNYDVNFLELSHQYKLAEMYNQNYYEFVKRVLKRNGIHESLVTSIRVCDYDQRRDLNEFESYCDISLSVYMPANRHDHDKDSIRVKSRAETTKTDESIKLKCIERIKPADSISAHSETLTKQRMIYAQNLKILIDTRKSFSIADFYCRLMIDFNVVESSRHIFRECLVNQRGQLTLKYVQTQTLLGKPVSRDQMAFHEPDIVLASQLNMRNLVKVEITHVLDFKRLCERHLGNPMHLQPHEKRMNVEFLSWKYKTRSESNGYVLYRASNLDLRPGSHKIILRPELISDNAILICDYQNRLYEYSANSVKQKIIHIDITETSCNNLTVLVENRGRLSDLDGKDEFGEHQRKGILSQDAIRFVKSDEQYDAQTISYPNWIASILDFSPDVFNRLSFNSDYERIDELIVENQRIVDMFETPAIAYARFNLNKTSSQQVHVYLLLKEFDRGVVLINGHLLGRFNSDLVSTVFVPDEYLFNGSNELHLFNLGGLRISNTAGGGGAHSLAVYFVDKNVIV